MLNTYLSLLATHRLSNTVKRRQLFIILQNIKRPLPPAELVLLTQNIMDRSNVYRSIDEFERAGIIKKVYTGWKESIELSDSFSRHHHHITCSQCGQTESFHETELLLSELQNISAKKKFSLNAHMLELTGVCINCQK